MKRFIPAWLLLVVLSLPACGQALATNSSDKWTGCYELHVAPADATKQLWGKLPRSFELLTNPAFEDTFQVRSFGSGPLSHWLISVWRLQGDDSAAVSWGTGFVGYRLTLTKSGDALIGTVHRFMDYEPEGPLPEFKVSVGRIACKQERKQR